MSAIGLIFLVVGAGLVVGCFIAAGRTRRFLSSAQEAQAEVVGLQKRQGTEREISYYPVLRFRTQSGATKEVVSSVGSNPPRYKEGDSLAILYDPQQPEAVRIHSFANVWIMPLVLGGTGALMLLVGCGITLFSGH